MNTAPQLTPELRTQLQIEYNANRSIAAFLLWTDKFKKTAQKQWYRSVADAYSYRFDLTSVYGYTVDEFLVVNTYKEFDSDEGDII